jgi:lipid-binding SYLF domain-containing protein
MNQSIFRKSLATVSVFLFVLSGLLFSAVAIAEEKADATIEISLVKAGLIVGGSGGSGTLNYKGKAYPLSIGGVSLGATIGVTQADLTGNVYNLKEVGDIEGTYTAGQASAALAGGEKRVVMNNSKGVQVDMQGKQIGAEFALDLNGMKISLK